MRLQTLSQLLAPLRFWEPAKVEPIRGAEGAHVSERIRAQYIKNCKKRASTRTMMRECGVLEDWKEAWDRS